MTDTLARHELPMPAGLARIVTSRPGPGHPWTTTVAAPGLPGEDEFAPWANESRDTARIWHDATVAAVRDRINACKEVR